MSVNEGGSPPDCPSCGKKLSPGNVTVDGGIGPITPPDAIDLLVNSTDEMVNVVIECGHCGDSFTRTVTIRTH